MSWRYEPLDFPHVLRILFAQRKASRYVAGEQNLKGGEWLQGAENA